MRPRVKSSICGMLKVLTILTLWHGLKCLAMSRVHEHNERAIDTEVKVRHEVTKFCARKAKVIDFIFQRNSSFRGVGVFFGDEYIFAHSLSVTHSLYRSISLCVTNNFNSDSQLE